jgi:nucleotide-binding universal stress UspA family protein
VIFISLTSASPTLAGEDYCMNASQIQRILLVAGQGGQPCRLVQRAGQLAFHLVPHAVDRVAPGAADEVLRLARQKKTDLMLFAAGQRHFLLEWLRPSCALRVMRRSRLPVLLVKPDTAKEYRKVVIATDFSPESVSAARTAFALAPAAHFVFLHAWRLPDEGLMRELELRPRLIALYRERARAAAQERLRALAASFGERRGASVACAAVYGAPHRAVDDFARAHDADLVVIGRRVRQPLGWAGLFGAGVRMISRPPCDLLVGTDDGIRISGRRRALERLAGES